jgi:hypothetical protein
MADFNGQKFTAPSYTLAEATSDPSPAQTYSVTGGGGVATVLKYEMRAKLSGSDVYWYATLIDTTGSEYPGGPAGLSQITFIKAHLL